jgi:endonuclease/exonuclease/phosphatase family metal-dependent hydrolase
MAHQENLQADGRGRGGPVIVGSHAVQESERTFKVATYNVHRCIGADNVYNPDRISAVLRSLKADLVGLQEVDSRMPAGPGMYQLDYLAVRMHAKAICGPCIQNECSHYGNALLTRLPVIDFRLIDLSVPGREPRGAIDVDIDAGGRVLRVIVTHLGCRAFERRRQIKRLIEYIGKGRRRPTVVMGDFNEWAPFSRGIRAINSHFGTTSARASFPSRFPVFSLDRIWVLGASRRATFHVEKSPLARIASDHLPLVAGICI